MKGIYRLINVFRMEGIHYSLLKWRGTRLCKTSVLNCYGNPEG